MNQKYASVKVDLACVLLLGFVRSVEAYTVPEIEMEPGVLAIFAALYGLPICFIGYRHYGLTFCLTSFASGGILAYIVAKLLKTSSFVAWIALNGSGFATIGLYLISSRVGPFSCGFSAGCLFGITVNIVVTNLVQYDKADFNGCILAGVFGILNGVLAITHGRPIVLISIAFFGAYSFCWAVGYFVGQYPKGLDLEASPKKLDQVPNLYYAIYLPTTAILTILGIVVQFKYTAIGVDHVPPKRSDRYISQDITYDPSSNDPADRIPSLSRTHLSFDRSGGSSL